MTLYEFASLLPNTVAAIGIWVGIFVMRRASKERADAEQNRHTEAMTALKAIIAGLETVIDRTAPRPDPAE